MSPVLSSSVRWRTSLPRDAKRIHEDSGRGLIVGLYQRRVQTPQIAQVTLPTLSDPPLAAGKESH